MQGWLDAPSTNFGFSVRSNAESAAYSARYFEGMFGITAPQLIITVPESGAVALLSCAVLGSLAFPGI